MRFLLSLVANMIFFNANESKMNSNDQWSVGLLSVPRIPPKWNAMNKVVNKAGEKCSLMRYEVIKRNCSASGDWCVCSSSPGFQCHITESVAPWCLDKGRKVSWGPRKLAVLRVGKSSFCKAVSKGLTTPHSSVLLMYEEQTSVEFLSPNEASLPFLLKAQRPS